MTKILRILNRLNVGGPTYNVAYLSRYLPSTYETQVLAGFKEPDEASSEYILQELGVAYQYVPTMYRSLSPGNDYKAYRFIKEYLDRYQPDIVHTHAAKAGALGRLAAHQARRRPKAILHTYHGNVFDGYFSPLKTKIFLGIERYLCSISTDIVAISDSQKRDLSEKYKIAPAHKIHVIPLGFDLDRFTVNTDLKRKQFREAYGIDDQTVVISIVGRLAPVKNHALFVDALAYLLGRYPKEKIKVFMVGDGELLGSIVERARTQGLSCCLPAEDHFQADIIFTSWRKDIDVVNAGSDIIALTSVNEGTPVSIIEALASGKAVISTDVGGVRDIITDGHSGVLAESGAHEYGEQLLRLVSQKEFRSGIAAAGRDHVLRRYSYHRLVSDMEMLYEKVLGR